MASDMPRNFVALIDEQMLSSLEQALDTNGKITADLGETKDVYRGFLASGRAESGDFKLLEPAIDALDALERKAADSRTLIAAACLEIDEGAAPGPALARMVKAVNKLSVEIRDMAQDALADRQNRLSGTPLMARMAAWQEGQDAAANAGPGLAERLRATGFGRMLATLHRHLGAGRAERRAAPRPTVAASPRLH